MEAKSPQWLVRVQFTFVPVGVSLISTEAIIPLNIVIVASPIILPVSGSINILSINTSLFIKSGLEAMTPFTDVILSLVIAFSSYESSSILKIVVYTAARVESSVSVPVLPNFITVLFVVKEFITKVLVVPL